MEETIYGRDSDTIDAMIATACTEGGDRTVTLGRNPDNPDSAWMITRAILLPDDFTLVLDGCRVELAPGTRDNIIRNIRARCSGGHGIVRLLVQDGIRMHHIEVSNVVDTTDMAAGDPRCQAAIRIGDVNFWNIRRNELDEMHHITVRGVESSGQAAVWIRGPLCDSSVTDVRCLADGPKYKVDAPVERVEFDPDQ